MEVDEEDVALQQQLAAEASAGASLGPTRVVAVVRSPDIEEGRRQLPIVAMEQEIMEAINLNDVVVSVV
jgi:HrpA-like RNA helicase